ncbi:hypothetical protein K378_01455 [Streptomyces sp. Amel2xB2]|uniref:hypothetical protein n=1 Tax=Streptomyces sp. Amel2xB2 TaxID=1305829 RepID=UPI000DBA1A9E|nr:hypothetical protein [Streptomyces sp. Amel2xB2]RAJ70290.1 hypothetical protein K378_01455 [Streptomyces sp. Amel2xB2]
MQQQISMDTALEVARERLGEKDWEITMLRARVRELERGQEPATERAQEMPYAPGAAGTEG